MMEDKAKACSLSFLFLLGSSCSPSFLCSPSHMVKEKKLSTDTCGVSRIFLVTSVGFGLITLLMFIIALAKDEKAQEKEIS